MSDRFNYSKQTENFGEAFVRLIYNDGTVVEPLSKHYNGLKRTDMKSVTVVSKDNKSLYTLDIVNDKLIYRRRNLIPPNDRARELEKLNGKVMDRNNPKRCFILATSKKITFVWDSGEVKEFDTWEKEEPYTCPNLREDEK